MDDPQAIALHVEHKDAVWPHSPPMATAEGSPPQFSPLCMSSGDVEKLRVLATTLLAAPKINRLLAATKTLYIYENYVGKTVVIQSFSWVHALYSCHFTNDRNTSDNDSGSFEHAHHAHLNFMCIISINQMIPFSYKLQKFQQNNKSKDGYCNILCKNKSWSHGGSFL